MLSIVSIGEQVSVMMRESACSEQYLTFYNCRKLVDRSEGQGKRVSKHQQWIRKRGTRGMGRRQGAALLFVADKVASQTKGP